MTWDAKNDSTLYDDKRFWVGDKEGIVITAALSEIYGSKEYRERYGALFGPFCDRKSALDFRIKK